MKHRNIDSIERGINLVRKLRDLPRRTSLNRDSWDYRHEGAEVVELAIICDLWNLEKRFPDDTAAKVSARTGISVDSWDLDDEGFVPDFTEAAYKIAFELDRGFFTSLHNNPEPIDEIFDEWKWIDDVMDKARECRRASDYVPVDAEEKLLLENFKPNQTKAAKVEVIVAKKFPGMTPDLALKIVKNSLI